MSETFVIIKKYVSVVLALIVALFGIGIPERQTKAATDESVTRIMSFNIRCGEFEDRYNYVPQLIGEYMPDSVGIQECTVLWYYTLRILLPEYAFVGVGRDSGKRDINCGEMSAILYRKDKYELVDSGTFWLSETPNEVSHGWDGACNRICTWVLLKNKETGKLYAHVNTHLDHVGPEARTNGLKLVREKALSFTVPTVVTGDFNFSEGSSLYNQLVSDGLKDTKHLASDSDNGFTYHGYNADNMTGGNPIDFICVNNAVTDVKSYKVIRDKHNGEYISDHFPIYSDMVIN